MNLGQDQLQWTEDNMAMRIEDLSRMMSDKMEAQMQIKNMVG